MRQPFSDSIGNCCYCNRTRHECSAGRTLNYNFLSVIIYALIKTQPKRINWNVQFIKYFLNQKELFENNGYNLTQIESSILYIKTLTYDKLHLKSEKELEDKCKEALLQYK